MRPFDGPAWRIIPTAHRTQPLTPAAAPEGRFHHSGQVAIYASLTAEGAGVAIQRYLTDAAPRLIIPVHVTADRIADHRGNRAASVVWQETVANGAPSPTWAFSDAARDAGAAGLLYSSRSRPDLTHIVLFDPSCIRPTGPPRPLDG